MYTYRKSVDIPSHAFMTQGELEEPAEASVQLQMVSAAEIMKISFFQCRIDHCYIYTYSSSTPSMQLHVVSAAKMMKIFFFQSRIDSSHTYTYSNVIDIMFDAVIT